LEEEIILPLTKGDEPKVGKMIGGKKIQEQVAGTFPVVGPTKNLKGVNKAPGIGMNLR
jgi:hypothetical protein